MNDSIPQAGSETVGNVRVPEPVFSCTDVNVHYGDKHAIKNVNIDIARKEVLAMIGPSGCGKSTFLRCLNRMNDTIPSARVTGRIALDGNDIHDKRQDVVQLRARVGMVFQKPNPFPKSIYENVAYGPRIHGLAADRAELDEIVNTSLRRAGLWEEVKDRLNNPGTSLSGGQQQRQIPPRQSELLAIDPAQGWTIQKVTLPGQKITASGYHPAAIVDDLHGAYRDRDRFAARYGVLVTGPSATADIEGVLRSLLVTLAGLEWGVVPADEENPRLVKLADRITEIARDNFIEGGVNRILLATDGDFNVGVSDTKSLIAMVEKERDSGITLTTEDLANVDPPTLSQLVDVLLTTEGGGLGLLLTAHMDTLASQGRLFRNHYVSVPTCGASRYAMLTGLRPTAVTDDNEAIHPETFERLFRVPAQNEPLVGNPSEEALQSCEAARRKVLWGLLILSVLFLVLDFLFVAFDLGRQRRCDLGQRFGEVAVVVERIDDGGGGGEIVRRQAREFELC